MAKQRYRVVGQTPQQPAEQPDAKALAAHRDSLYARLEVGYDRIAQGLEDGQDVMSWEDFWIQLLREYESVCDQLTADLAADLAASEVREDWTAARATRLPGVR
jgi:hypothetical protein